MDNNVEIRFMEMKDLDGVMAVEKDAFTTPWTKSAFVSELSNNRFAYYFVAEVDQQIVAYAGVWIIIDEAHITNIAVHSSYRRKGIGDLLLKNTMELAKILGAKTLTLEVRVSNDSAKNLYLKNGFQYGGIRKNYYTDNLEDAQIMWVNLDEK